MRFFEDCDYQLEQLAHIYLNAADYLAGMHTETLRKTRRRIDKPQRASDKANVGAKAEPMPKGMGFARCKPSSAL